MKGGASMGSRSNGGGGGERVVVGKSESEKEKTKMRERQRRAITTNIFHGLRKHGGYQLSHRADINQVLRELAREAGWVIEPDGTTYRSTTLNAFCPLCGAGKRNATLMPTPTTTTSTIAVASGECSTTASPRPFTTADSISTQLGDMPFAALYDMYGRVGASEIHHCSNVTSYAGVGVTPGMAVAYRQQEQYFPEARASNQNTPMGSPSPY